MSKQYCIICGKELSEKRIKQNKDTCSLSCATRKRFLNPEQRAKISQSVKAVYKNNPEVKRNLKRAMKNIYNNKEIQDRRIASIKKTMSTQEYHNKRSEIAINLWNDEEYRRKTVATMKERFSSEEYKQHQSQAQKIAQNKPEVKKIKSEILSKRLIEKYKNPEERQKASKIQKIAQNKPEVKKKRSLSIASKEVQQKIHDTKKKNGTFNSSSSEKAILSLLKQKFNEVYYQYRSEAYPFNCDFYIKDLDLYIEYNGTWTHGGRPFNKNDKDCIEQLNEWKEKAKTSSYYLSAISTWTYKDTRKLSIFITNKLNFKIFYNYNQFYTWYKEGLE